MIVFFKQQKFILLGLVGVLSGFGLQTIVDGHALSQVLAQSTGLETDVRVYGQVPQPNRIRKSYLVFESVGNNEIVGAYYQPRSEFSCFVGSRHGDNLSLHITSVKGSASPEVEVSLEELYSLSSPSLNDKRMLKICRHRMSETGKYDSLTRSLDIHQSIS